MTIRINAGMWCAALAGTALLQTAVCRGQSIVGIGTLPGHTQSVAGGVSSDGSVVCGLSFAGQTLAASVGLRWTAAGGATSIGTLGGPDSRAFGISGDGLTLVGWSSQVFPSGPEKAIRWQSGTGLQNLGTLGGENSQAYCTSADGTVVGGFSWLANGQTVAIRWTATGGMQNLGTLGGNFSTIRGMSADGSVLVGSSSLTPTAVTHRRAIRWTSAGGMQNLGVLNGTDSEAAAASADGSVVTGVNTVYSASQSLQSQSVFRWTMAGGMQDLGAIGGVLANASAISADGSVIVGDSGSRAFLWRADLGMVNLAQYLAASGLDMSHWVLVRANGISADGRTIVGEGPHDGVLEGFVVTLPPVTPPAPSPFAMLSPESGGVAGGPTPTLTWQSSANATSYAVSLTPAGGTTIVLTTSGTSVAVPAGALSFCRHATWSVVASGVGGSTSSTSGVWSFSISSRADFNHDGRSTVSDIFEFLSAWFAGSASADFNQQGGITVSDIFNFLDTWFLGCP